MTAKAFAASQNRSPDAAKHRRALSLTLTLTLTFVFLFCLAAASSALAADDPVENPFPLERVFTFGPDGTKATRFDDARSVALDQQRDSVYVLKEAGAEATLFKFDPGATPVDFGGANTDIEGNRVKGLDSMGTVLPTKLAVDSTNGNIYVVQPDSILAFEFDGEPVEFTTGPGAGTNRIPGLGDVRSVAVDANGSIYVGIRGSNTVSVFALSGAPLVSFATTTDPVQVALAPNGVAYLAASGTTLKKFTPSSFPVSPATTYSESTFATKMTGPGEFPGVAVDPLNGDVYTAENNTRESGDFEMWLHRYNAAGTLLETAGAPGSSTHMALGGYFNHLAVWGNAREVANGVAAKLYYLESSKSQVTALGRSVVPFPPEISKASALDVTADSAKLRALVNPNNAETTYRFEYGLNNCALNACAEIPLGGESVGDGNNPVAVSQALAGLEPETTYHYRILAENSEGPALLQPDHTFTTQALGVGYELIDSRAWEMVSPPDKGGAELMGPDDGRIQAAEDGEGLIYVSLGSIEAGPEGNRAPQRSGILARRSHNGWRSRDLSLPNQQVLPINTAELGEFKFFDPGLSQGILLQHTATPLSPQASDRTPYLWQDGGPPAFTPLLSGAEGFANVPPGTDFGGDLDEPPVKPVGTTPDLSHVVLRSGLTDPLVEGFGPPYEGLYLWSAGQLHPISVLPLVEGGSMSPIAVFGSGATSVQNAISADGSRVFWGNGGSALYVRDTLAEETARVDRAQPGAGGAGGAAPVFQGASADGTVVFFADTRDLTTDSSPGIGRDLYRCELPAESPVSGCTSLTNVSPPLPESGESAQVLGMATGISEDGARAYFVAKGVLDEDANHYGESAAPGEPNLYLSEAGQEVRFIATLDEEDKGSWGMGFGVGAAGLTAAVSPSGRYLVFSSQRSLTGSFNLDATTDEPVQQAFRYDAEADQLACVSCNPSGSAPQGQILAFESLINPNRGYEGARAAATVPSGYAFQESRILVYRSRSALDNGRVFFNAFDSLVPADSNGQWDVYQWEPTGVGGCTASTRDAATVPSSGGCLSLLSSGTAESEAAFLDAPPTGDDVFFITPARLSVTDVDKELDVYDARVDGVPAKLTPSAECLGEACQPAATPPPHPTPATSVFRGPGNPVAADRQRCPKGKRLVKRKGKQRCVPRKGKGRNHKRHTHKRGTSR